MDGIQCILNRDTFQVPCSDFESQREVQINLLDGRSSEELLQRLLFVYRCWRGIQFPKVTESTQVFSGERRYQAGMSPAEDWRLTFKKRIRPNLPIQLLRLFSYLKLFSLLLYDPISLSLLYVDTRG